MWLEASADKEILCYFRSPQWDILTFFQDGFQRQGRHLSSKLNIPAVQGVWRINTLLAHHAQLKDSLLKMTLDRHCKTNTAVNRSIVVTQGSAVVYDWLIQSVPVSAQPSYGSHQLPRSQWVGPVKIIPLWHHRSDPPPILFQPISPPHTNWPPPRPFTQRETL